MKQLRIKTTTEYLVHYWDGDVEALDSEAKAKTFVGLSCVDFIEKVERKYTESKDINRKERDYWVNPDRGHEN